MRGGASTPKRRGRRILAPMARTCPSCGAEAREDDRFCGRCGAALAGIDASSQRPEAYCTSCGAPLTARDRFCGRCGAATGRPATAATEETEEGFDPDDFFHDWERPVAAPDEAKTEPVQILRRSDTAVLPQISPDAPEPHRPLPVERPPRRGFPLGATLAFLGAVAVVASSALPWLAAERTFLPRDVPISSLLFGAAATRGPSLGIVLLGLGILGALIALLTMAVPALRFLRRLVGLITLVAPVLFVARVLGAGLGPVLEVLAPGVYVAAGGALVELLAGRWFRR